ncbi:MAG: hypothetical protein C0518_01030 [Opitutus sp.]|nr:hypothetical protein [Opitutus sp.]
MGIARFIEVGERDRLLGALHSTRDQLLATLGLNTGLRVGSILSLRWRQLWRNGGPVQVLEVPRRQLKGGRSAHRRRVLSRRVPVNAALADAIHAFVAADFGGCEPDEEAFVFASARRAGQPLTRQQAYNIIARAAARAGLQGTVAPHGLRRSFAGDVYEATGHDLVATQMLLGHSSPLVTAAYLRPREDELNAVVLRLPGTVGGRQLMPAAEPRICISGS